MKSWGWVIIFRRVSFYFVNNIIAYLSHEIIIIDYLILAIMYLLGFANQSTNGTFRFYEKDKTEIWLSISSENTEKIYNPNNLILLFVSSIGCWVSLIVADCKIPRLLPYCELVFGKTSYLNDDSITVSPVRSAHSQCCPIFVEIFNS